jgi:hypothetical protein
LKLFVVTTEPDQQGSRSKDQADFRFIEFHLSSRDTGYGIRDTGFPRGDLRQSRATRIDTLRQSPAPVYHTGSFRSAWYSGCRFTSVKKRFPD